MSASPLAVCQGCYTPRLELGPCARCGCRLTLVAEPPPPEGPVAFLLRTDLPEPGRRRVRVYTHTGGRSELLGTLSFERSADWQMFGSALAVGVERWNRHLGRTLYRVEIETAPEVLREER